MRPRRIVDGGALFVLSLFTAVIRAPCSNESVRIRIERSESMKKYSIATCLALLLALSGSAWAAVVTVGGEGQSFDPGIALENARADAQAKCTAQGGTPLAEVYNHLTRANLWLASSIWNCDVP
jgi:hypothetical protein